jgi:uncharacterized membrane protein YjjP (DUF1212 family)
MYRAVAGTSMLLGGLAVTTMRAGGWGRMGVTASAVIAVALVMIVPALILHKRS